MIKVIKIIGVFMAVVAFGGAALAEDSPTKKTPTKSPIVGIMIGHNNDLFFGERDRWRSAGAYAAVVTQSKKDRSRSNATFRRAKSFHMTGEIVAPIALNAPLDKIDRPYAGIASFGMAWHWIRAGNKGEVQQRLYADISFTGPKTQALKVQRELHGFLGKLAAPPSQAVRDTQIGNGIYPTINYEWARQKPLGTGNARLRFSGEAQAGVESFIRGGVDILFGQSYHGGFVLREPVAGHVLAVGGTRPNNWAVATGFGGDVTLIADSHIFGTVRFLRARPRLRGGVFVQRRGYDLFLGAVYLGREFPAQKSGQLSASIDMLWHF